MKPKRKGFYTVDWPNAKEERAFFDGENWYRFASDANPERITHTWESGAPRPIDVWRDLTIDRGWYQVEGAANPRFWDGETWFVLSVSHENCVPVRAMRPAGGEPG